MWSLSVPCRHGWRCLWILRIPASYRHLRTWGLPASSRPQKSKMGEARRGNDSLQSSAQGCQTRMFEVCTSSWKLSCFEDNDLKHAYYSLQLSLTWKSQRISTSTCVECTEQPRISLSYLLQDHVWQHWFCMHRKVTVWPPGWCAGHPWMWDVKLIRLVYWCY